MKNSSLRFLILSLLVGINLDCSPSSLNLSWPKDPNWSLTSNFFKMITEIFKPTIFIESGTYAGTTALRAASFFKEIHTIELSEYYYKKAKQRLTLHKNIFTYKGNSAIVLPKILSKINGKPLFWLDAHYSGSNTAKANSDTPIIQELYAIKNSGIQNAIIMIDDIRCFNPKNSKYQDYPTLKNLYETLLSINPDYEFIIYGDIGIAFDKNENIHVSDTIRALTSIKFFMSPSDISLNKEESNKILKACTEKEKKMIHILYNSFPYDPYIKYIYSLVTLK